MSKKIVAITAIFASILLIGGCNQHKQTLSSESSKSTNNYSDTERDSDTVSVSNTHPSVSKALSRINHSDLESTDTFTDTVTDSPAVETYYNADSSLIADDDTPIIYTDVDTGYMVTDDSPNIYIDTDTVSTTYELPIISTDSFSTTSETTDFYVNTDSFISTDVEDAAITEDTDTFAEHPSDNSEVDYHELAYEHVWRYGICSDNCEVILDNGDIGYLYRNERVAVVKEPTSSDWYIIAWYNHLAKVNSSNIFLFDEEFTPNFTSGTWAGCIYKEPWPEEWTGD